MINNCKGESMIRKDLLWPITGGTVLEGWRNSFRSLSQRSGWGKLLLFAGLLFILGSGCAQLELTPVVSPATEVYHPGKFVWYDLLTEDVEGAQDFYGNLLGWTFATHGRYTVITNKKQTIGGVVEVKPKDHEKHAARWLASLSVADVDQAAAFVRQAGGVVHEGPVDKLKRGRMALVSDPLGAQLVLMHALGGDPEDIEAPIGSWLWVELWSNDPESSLAFYKKLGGYHVVDWDDNYWLLETDRWRAGVRLIPEKDLEVRWVPTVRVADTVVTSRYAEMLGGKVLVEPGDASHDDSAALIEDPAGALFVVQQWEKQPAVGGEDHD